MIDDAAKLPPGAWRVRRVEFYLNRQLTDDSLAKLAPLTELEGLGLHGTAISDRGLVHLQGMKKLQSLSLRTTGVTDAGLQSIAHLVSATGRPDDTVELWDVASNGRRQTLQVAAPGMEVRRVAFSPEGRHLAVISTRGTVAIVRLAN
jgi:WD40 repeat protein